MSWACEIKCCWTKYCKATGLRMLHLPSPGTSKQLNQLFPGRSHGNPAVFLALQSLCSFSWWAIIISVLLLCWSHFPGFRKQLIIILWSFAGSFFTSTFLFFSTSKKKLAHYGNETNAGSNSAAVLVIGDISGDVSENKIGPDAPELSGAFWNQHNAALCKRLHWTRKICASLIPLPH